MTWKAPLFVAFGIIASGCTPAAVEPTYYDLQISGGVVFDGVSTEGGALDIFVQLAFAISNLQQVTRRCW